MAFKKIDKEFCLTDNSVNCYGYRLLTEGFLMERFRPAIGYLMHNRGGGVAVKWEDLRTEGDKVWAKPVVNTKAYPNLVEEIEAGFYDAASVGHIIALEWSDDEAMKLDGQTGVTVTKWFCRECSIVDIPGNFNALAKLYDDNDNMLMDLSAKTIDNNIPKKTENQMEKLLLTGAMLTGLNLMADATQEQVNTAFADLLAKAKRTDDAEKKLKELQDERTKETVQNILKQGVDEGRLTKELAAELEISHKENPEGLKNLVAKMPKQTRVTGQAIDLSAIPEKYRGKSFQDLYNSGELANLKAECPEYYNQLTKKDK